MFKPFFFNKICYKSTLMNQFYITLNQIFRNHKYFQMKLNPNSHGRLYKTNFDITLTLPIQNTELQICYITDTIMSVNNDLYLQ